MTPTVISALPGGRAGCPKSAQLPLDSPLVPTQLGTCGNDSAALELLHGRDSHYLTSHHFFINLHNGFS